MGIADLSLRLDESENWYLLSVIVTPLFFVSFDGSLMMRIAVTCFGAFAVALAWVNPAVAADIPVPNFSFEDPVLMDGEINFSDPPGWISALAPFGAGTENHSNGKFAGAQASDGENVYWNNVGSNPNDTGQLVSGAPLGVLTPGTYEMMVDFLFRTDSISGDSMPDMEFGLSVDGSTILGTPTSLTDALDVGGLGLISTQTYTLEVLDGDALVGSPYVILFNASHNGLSTWNQFALDNVRLTGPVSIPEPTSAWLLGMGAAVAVSAYARRRK